MTGEDLENKEIIEESSSNSSEDQECGIAVDLKNIGMSKKQAGKELRRFRRLYRSLLRKIDKYCESDRVKCEEAFDMIKKASEKNSTTGILQTLNAATKNMLDSTQRLREILQEVGKAKIRLEEMVEMAAEEEIADNSEFDRNTFI